MFERLVRLVGVVSRLDAVAQLQTEEFVRRLLAEDPRYADASCLNRFELQVFSQGGEDGVIDEIFRRVGARSKTFVEFGVGDGLENNTVFQLQRGWSGHWIEGAAAKVRRIRRAFAGPIASRRLTVTHALVRPDNIEGLLSAVSVPTEFDLLSVDIDGNDYWVWRAIERFRPRVVVVEYNALFGPRERWIMPYDARHWWRGTSRHGASLSALVELAGQKGYRLVACSLSGVNAFFVSQDDAGDRFEGPFTAERHWSPSRPALALRRGHAREFTDRPDGV